MHLFQLIQSDHSIVQYICKLEVPVPDSHHGGGAVVLLIKILPQLLHLHIYIPDEN